LCVEEEAQRIAAFIKPMDTYAMVIVNECVVTVYTAKSQSLKAMASASCRIQEKFWKSYR